MIFIQNGFKNRGMQQVPSTVDDFNTLAKMAGNPQEANVTSISYETFKRESLQYIIAGELDGERRNENLKNITIGTIDFDEIEDEQKFLLAVSSRLANVAFVLWPSISYGFKGARYHLAVDLSRPLMNKDEKTAVILKVSKILGFESDPAMETWAQMFSAPVVTPRNKGKIVVHHGGKIDVDTAIGEFEQDKNKHKYVAETKPLITSNHTRYSDDYVRELVSEYAFENDIDDEKKFASLMIILVSYYQSGDISEVALRDSVRLLAGNNSDWANNNEAKLDQHMRTTYAQNVVSLPKMFKTIVPVHERADESRDYTTRGIITELVQRSSARLAEKQAALEESDPKTKQHAKLDFADAASIILASVPMWKDRSAFNSPVYIYDAEKGIYSATVSYFNSLVHKVLPAATEKDCQNVKAILDDDDMVANGKAIHVKELVACNNGIARIGDGKLSLIQFSPKYHFCAKVATNLVPDAEKPIIHLENGGTWDPVSWLRELACNDDQLLVALIQVIGDAAQSSYSRKKAIWLIGNPKSSKANGANGKSTYEALLESIIGQENTAHLKVDQFSERFALGEIFQKSLVIGDDVQAGKYIDDQSNFNSAVTGDTLRADVKNQQPFNFTFGGSIVQSTNQLPKFANQTGGTNRRMLILPFMANFNGKNANDKIKTDYIHRQNVREYLLAKGLLASALKDEFMQPQVSQKLLNDFEVGNDQVANFIDENNWTSEVVPLVWGYSKFAQFCKDAGFTHPLTRPAFTQRMTEFGWVKKKGRVTHENFVETKAFNDMSGDEFFGKNTSCLVKSNN
ncbi:phage/plasmid primase, P4 family [Lacticaseibacillus mingshuiensis]|uniref:Phage/plasmid primase, P4 family n=1 Tax=Lacticaseibacillus mingshuiensis TaxID=2799574 RepID=A0ABW4CGJ9_9LACO|nr:phage/plasmid primase, P4 family [Lacticaseibacillus mingshuiensis]